MLIYEYERTKNIVTRLVALGNMVRTAAMLTSAVLWGGLYFIAAVLISIDYWWFGLIFGVLFGALAGALLGSVVTLLMEGLAQMLVAQGEILAGLRKGQ
jgi:hypothetical protein